MCKGIRSAKSQKLAADAHWPKLCEDSEWIFADNQQKPPHPTESKINKGRSILAMKYSMLVNWHEKPVSANHLASIQPQIRHVQWKAKAAFTWTRTMEE